MKAKIILVMNDGNILSGDGIVDATKTIQNDAILTATLVLKIPKK